MCRMYPLLAPAFFSVAAMACSGGAPPRSGASPAGPVTGATTPHARFAAFTARFLSDYLANRPVEATNLGDHSHDGQWPDLSAEGEAKEIQGIDAARAELAAFKTDELDEEDRTDASILANRLAQMRFEISEEKQAETRPMLYSTMLGDGLDLLVSRDFAPLDVRMKSLAERLRGLPAVVAVAKKRLARPARVNTETANSQIKGLIGLCERDLPEFFAKVPAQKAELEAARGPALAALHELQTFLEKELLPRSDGSFRAGAANFARVLGFELDDPSVDPAGLLRDARAAMADTQAQLLATALELWPTLMTGPTPQPKNDADKKAAIRAVLDKLAEDHSDDATIVRDAQRMMEEATAFVRKNDLVRIPDEPWQVIEMPEYKRGFSTAYCDSSGPLEKKPQTFIAISPPPADWPAERRMSQYREYNRSMLADLLVHEAMPGHYLQIMHSNRFPSPVRTVFQNGAFVEGWAVYGEWLMAKYGFGGPKVRMEQLKMLLRSATNAVLDHEIQAGSMDEKEALALMKDEAFQEEGEAIGKWRRARLSRGQLSTYFYGFRELMKIRTQAEKGAGASFQERAYNDRLLAYGSPPLRVARERMLAK
ncbi:MAG TPA: DUF885 domain-containing protein [Polyangiaceae bacterium]